MIVSRLVFLTLILGDSSSFTSLTFPSRKSDTCSCCCCCCRALLGTQLNAKRRDVLRNSSLLLSPLLGQNAARATTTTTTTTDSASSSTSTSLVPLLADLPIIRLKLPPQAFGREYVVIQLMIDNQGPFDFMVDSGLTTELITPHLKQQLHLASTTAAAGLQGIVAGGNTQGATEISILKGAELCCGRFANADQDQKCLKLPPLTAVVTDFPQEHIDPAHNVEGMLGMELLSQFDVDFDFPNNRLRLYKPGTAIHNAPNTKSLVEIPAVVINETGLIGIRVSAPHGASNPVLGFLDCGSGFSAMNWQAAEFLGLPAKGDPKYRKGPSINAVGVDGRVIQMPTTPAELTFAGNVIQNNGKIAGFEQPPSNFESWKVNVAVGDLGVFPSLLGDGIHPYTGPAALIGLDVLSQRRVIFEAGRGGGRQRRVFVGSA